MSIGALAVVAEWSDAVDRRDGRRLAQLSHDAVQVAGPRGTVQGRQVLSDWLARAGFSARPRRWFCGADGSVVVEQDARWVDLGTGEELGRSVVAARFRAIGAVVAGTSATTTPGRP